jgi:hypothetical protein
MISMPRQVRRLSVAGERILALSFVVGSCVLIAQIALADFRDSLRSSDPLPDLSGLAWMGEDLFVAVHDAKNPDELDRPRVSILALPTSLEGVLWRPIDPGFATEKSNDFESASRIPGTNKLLFVESTDGGGPFDRIFLAELRNDTVEIRDEVRWSDFTQSHNVEATAVFASGAGELVFVWGERASGDVSTEIKWIQLATDPFRIGGAIESVTFELPTSAFGPDGAPLYDRPLVAMDIDSAGRIYTAAAQDPEGRTATPDDGPFRSVIYMIGRMENGGIALDPEPTVMGVIDGLKVESLAVREHDDEIELYYGTDDENYGGILRPVPLPPHLQP